MGFVVKLLEGASLEEIRCQAHREPSVNITAGVKAAAGAPVVKDKESRDCLLYHDRTAHSHGGICIGLAHPHRRCQASTVTVLLAVY
jgi:hypothetical protein